MTESFKPRLNLLTAYPYTNTGVLSFVAEMGDDVRWLLDSGAFTAYKAGRVIALDEYCAFLDNLPMRPWRYFALDVIGDPTASDRNYKIMLDRGYDPIPVFTRGGSLDQLDRLFETSDLVGLGGIAGREAAAYRWLRAVMAHVGDRKVHILGLGSFDWIKHLRPYSLDASTWENGARYGEVAAYVGNGRMAKYRRGVAGSTNIPPNSVTRAPPSPELIRALRRVGVDAYRLAKTESWAGSNSLVRWTGVASWIAASIDIERVLGTKLFLAVAALRPEMFRAGFLAATGQITDLAAVLQPVWERTNRMAKQQRAEQPA